MSDTMMADHWWWRTGWGVGTRFLTWHLTFERATEVHRLAAVYRTALAGVPGLDLVPDQWLHLTMQGLGFVDQVPGEVVQAILDAARTRLAAVPAFALVFDRPTVTPEAILWSLDSQGPALVRDAIRGAIGEVVGDVPESADGFRAHVTIAYSNAALPSGPVRDVIAAVPSRPAEARITGADLIILNRDNRMYEWDTHTTVPLAVP